MRTTSGAASTAPGLTIAPSPPDAPPSNRVPPREAGSVKRLKLYDRWTTTGTTSTSPGWPSLPPRLTHLPPTGSLPVKLALLKL